MSFEPPKSRTTGAGKVFQSNQFLRMKKARTEESLPVRSRFHCGPHRKDHNRRNDTAPTLRFMAKHASFSCPPSRGRYRNTLRRLSASPWDARRGDLPIHRRPTIIERWTPRSGNRLETPEFTIDKRTWQRWPSSARAAAAAAAASNTVSKVCLWTWISV